MIRLQFGPKMPYVWPLFNFRCIFTGTAKEYRRAVMIGKPTTDTKERLPIYAADLQPRSLEALALESLLKNSPELKDRDPQVLKEIGIPPQMNPGKSKGLRIWKLAG